MIDPIEIGRVTFNDKVLASRCSSTIERYAITLTEEIDIGQFSHDTYVAKAPLGKWDVVVLRSPRYFETYYAAEACAIHWIERTRVALMEEIEDPEESEVTIAVTTIKRSKDFPNSWTCMVRLDDATWDLRPDGHGEIQ
jgi:hypothetical protein